MVSWQGAQIAPTGAKDQPVSSRTQTPLGRHVAPATEVQQPPKAKQFYFDPYVSLFANPAAGLSGRRADKGTWRQHGRSAPEILATFGQFENSLTAFVERQQRARVFLEAKSSRGVEASFEQPESRTYSWSAIDVRLPALSSQTRRAISGLAATSAVTAVLLFSGSSSRAVFAEAASIDRIDEGSASRSASGANIDNLAPTTTTAVPVPPPEVTTTVPPVTTTTAPPPPPPPPTWATPTPGARLSSSFGNRVNPVSGRYAKHEGVDYAARYGSDIHVVADGVVTQAGWKSGYGYYTCVKHDDSVSTCYGHQSKILVDVGQSVSRDEVIGRVGNTGNSTGPHLHFEVRRGGTAVNPLNFL